MHPHNKFKEYGRYTHKEHGSKGEFCFMEGRMRRITSRQDVWPYNGADVENPKLEDFTYETDWYIFHQPITLDIEMQLNWYKQ